MQFPITIGLHRSFYLIGGYFLVHVLALLVVWLPAWPTVVSIGLSALIVLLAFAGWRQINQTDLHLRLLATGHLECAVSGAYLPAMLLPGATVHPWLTVMRIELAGKTKVILVAPDSASREDRRRLRVWLRWRADFNSSAGDGL